MPFCGELSRRASSRSWSERRGTSCGAARAIIPEPCPCSRWRRSIQSLRLSGGGAAPRSMLCSRIGLQAGTFGRGAAERPVFPRKHVAWPVPVVTQVTTPLSVDCRGKESTPPAWVAQPRAGKPAIASGLSSGRLGPMLAFEEDTRHRGDHGEIGENQAGLGDGLPESGRDSTATASVEYRVPRVPREFTPVEIPLAAERTLSGLRVMGR